jgi:hypothetical protein
MRSASRRNRACISAGRAVISAATVFVEDFYPPSHKSLYLIFEISSGVAIWQSSAARAQERAAVTAELFNYRVPWRDSDDSNDDEDDKG